VYAGLAITAAVATPDWSPVTMGALGASLVVLYEGSLAFARVVFSARIKEQAALASEEAALAEKG
jgi:sec-independent protein translocase protein TatC